MNKRVFIICVILLMFIIPLALQIVLAQIPGIDTTSPEQIPEQLEQLKNQSAWAYLGQRFQVSLMKNPVIVGIDSFCQKISIVFRILFGMDYSLSVTLLFVIALWLLVFLDLGNILSSYSPFSSSASYGISLGIAIVFSQIQIFKIIVNFTGTLIYAREAGWARALLIFAVILLLIFADQLSRYLGKYLKKVRAAKEKEESFTAGKEIQEFAKGLEKGRAIAR